VNENEDGLSASGESIKVILKYSEGAAGNFRSSKRNGEMSPLVMLTNSQLHGDIFAHNVTTYVVEGETGLRGNKE
jgi:hypothetical protein